MKEPVDMSPSAITGRVNHANELSEAKFKEFEEELRQASEKGKINWAELAKTHKWPFVELNMLARTTDEDACERGQFYEAWGDSTRSPLDAIDHYNQADFYFGIFASWSTSGGEGTARMRDVDRVRNKVRNVKREL